MNMPDDKLSKYREKRDAGASRRPSPSTVSGRDCVKAWRNGSPPDVPAAMTPRQAGSRMALVAGSGLLGLALAEVDLRALLQLVGAFHHNQFPWRKAAVDGHVASLGQARLYPDEHAQAD